MERMNERGSAPRVTVLGVGTMGSAMARRLLGRGFGVGVWDRDHSAMESLAEDGAEAYSGPADAARHANVVLTLLPTVEIVRDVMSGQGVLDAMRTGSIWAQMGTIGVEGTDELAAEVAISHPGLVFVDAPVSGSRGPAESGQLVILGSGPAEARETVDPVFAALGRRTLWLGPAGFGSRMKLVLNTWLAFEVEAAAEALALATHLGISGAELSDALTGSPLVSPYAAGKLEKMQSEDDSADFPLEFGLKDLRLAQAAGGAAVAPVAGAIAHRWEELAAAGWGSSDVSAARHGLKAPEGDGRGT